MKRTIIIIIFSICALACGTMIWIDSSLLNAIATVLIGLITGVLSSTLVTLYFNSEEKKQKEGIKKTKLESFFYSCADFMYWIERDINEMIDEKVILLNNRKQIISFIDKLKEENKNKILEELDEKCDYLVNTGISYISPFFYSYISLDNNLLLLQGIINVNEYNFFNNMIRKDIFKEFIETRKEHRYFEGASAEYLLHSIKVALNLVYDSVKVFPQIKEIYGTIKKDME